MASDVDNINNFTAAGQAAQAQKNSSAASLVQTADQFIKLLTTQLQNQDPTKPMETDQITQQIASLSQVQEQIDINTNLKNLAALYTQTQSSNAVAYIGKYVEATGNLSALQDGSATFVYTLPSDANSVQIQILDTDGNVVFNGSGTKIAGRNTVGWDGTKDDGTQAPDGTYTFKVTALDDAGKAITATTSSFGKVSSVETVTDNNGNLQNDLALGDILVPLSQVVSVRA